MRALKGDASAVKFLLKVMQDTATGDLKPSGPVSVRWMTNEEAQFAAHEDALDALT